MNVDELEAIDVHTHAEVSSGGGASSSPAHHPPSTDTSLEEEAHPSFPWQDEALSVATHKPAVYIDLSGWSPKYFPPQLVQYANTLLKDKVLFGSDYPMLSPDRWLADFAKLPIKDEVRPKILKHNAARLLGLTDDS